MVSPSIIPPNVAKFEIIKQKMNSLVLDMKDYRVDVENYGVGIKYFKKEEHALLQEFCRRTGTCFLNAKLTLIELIRISFCYFLRLSPIMLCSLEMNISYDCISRFFKKIRLNMTTIIKREWASTPNRTTRFHTPCYELEVDESLIRHLNNGQQV